MERQERKRKAEELKQEFIKKQQKKKTEDEMEVIGMLLIFSNYKQPYCAHLGPLGDLFVDLGPL